jgi:hypothetical protein
MFTQDQMDSYRSLQNGELFADEELTTKDLDWQPPRVAFADEFPALADSPEFDGALLLVGFTDEQLADCECDSSHVAYVAIRSDGMMSSAVTSNSVQEAELCGMIDPVSMLLSSLAGIPPEVGEPQFPTWDRAREVTPDEWPADSVTLDEGRTDMTAFEF